jgi:hypothetical protein
MTNRIGRKKLYTFLIIYAFNLSLLSKSEVQFLKGQKQVSKSHKFKVKLIIQKIHSSLLENLVIKNTRYSLQ